MKRGKRKYKPGKTPEAPRPAIQKDRVIELVWQLAEPLCAAEGVELIHVEYQREPGGWIMRLYIGKPGGVTIEDCAVISRQLGDLLDIKLDPGIPYTMEISSPGPDRPVSKLSDFDRFAGHTTKIRTSADLCGQKNFTGVLLGTMDGYILHMLDTETVAIPHRNITKARLVNYNGDHKC